MPCWRDSIHAEAHTLLFLVVLVEHDKLVLLADSADLVFPSVEIAKSDEVDRRGSVELPAVPVE